MINFFKRNKDNVLNEEIEKQEYFVLSGIIEVIEFKKTKKEIDGVLLDIEGREFQFKISPNGDLLRLSGVKEDLPLAWHICADYLKRQYGKNEINELRKEIRMIMANINKSISDLKNDIAEIEIPEIIQSFEPEPVLEEIKIPEPIRELMEEEQDDFPNLQDYSDEDLASHALKVLNGEVSLDV
jgi:hypothetical protein